MPGLLDSIEIRGMKLANRIVMPPMANSFANDEGIVAQRLLDHYAARARGVGLVVIENAYVSPQGRRRFGQIGIHSDEMIPGLRRLAQVVQERGAKVAIQMNHCAAGCKSSEIGEQPVAPSDVLTPHGSGEVPRPLTDSEVEQLILAYGQAARRGKEAGFDAVEIHAAHGYMLNEFASPYTNRRTDRWGGSAEKRMRFPVEVVREVRRQVGPDFPISIRLGAADLVEGGLELEEGKVLAAALEEAGVDLMDVSAGLVGGRPTGYAAPGFFVSLAEGVKQVVKVPVVGVGGIKDPKFAESLIREGRVDMVAVGRAMLMDPEWALKAAQALAPGIPPPPVTH